MAITHFVTQFIHVLRHPRVKNRKQKKIFRENCLENVVSDLWTKNVYVSTKVLLEKGQNLKTTKNLKP